MARPIFIRQHALHSDGTSPAGFTASAVVSESYRGDVSGSKQKSVDTTISGGDTPPETIIHIYYDPQGAAWNKSLPQSLVTGLSTCEASLRKRRPFLLQQSSGIWRHKLPAVFRQRLHTIDRHRPYELLRSYLSDRQEQFGGVCRHLPRLLGSEEPPGAIVTLNKLRRRGGSDPCTPPRAAGSSTFRTGPAFRKAPGTTYDSTPPTG